jgi:hypothetical protein
VVLLFALQKISVFLLLSLGGYFVWALGLLNQGLVMGIIGKKKNGGNFLDGYTDCLDYRED